MPEFQLVLPCFNEAKSLENLIGRAKIAASKSGLTSDDFQLILVENGSRDNSREILNKLKSDPLLTDWFQFVLIDQNQGYGYGLQQGLKTTTAQFVGWSHADQQCDPADAIKAIEILKNSQAMTLVKGVRNGRSAPEKIVSRVFEIFAFFILGEKIHEINAQPKVFRRELLESCPDSPNDFAFDLYVLYCALKAGYQIKTFEVNFPPRVHGLSNWAFSFKNRWRTIRNMIYYMWELRQKS